MDDLSIISKTKNRSLLTKKRSFQQTWNLRVKFKTKKVHGVHVAFFTFHIRNISSPIKMHLSLDKNSSSSP